MEIDRWQTGDQVHGLRRRIDEIRATSQVGGRGVVRLAAVVALLALGAGGLPAVGNAAAPGQLYAFGLNGSGELGNETNLDGEPNPTPALVSLPQEAGSAIQAAAGGGFSLVVTASGQVYGFGENSYGQLGNTGNLENPFAANPMPTPITLPGATGPATQAAGGGDHSLVATATGQLYAFGLNNRGELGNPTNAKTELANPTPTLVELPGENGPVTQIAAGGFFSLAVTSTGQLYSFGSDAYGQLGSESSSVVNSTPTLVELPGENGPVTQVAAGISFSLAVTSTGQLFAFGENRLGQLGTTTNNQTTKPNPTPTRISLPGETGPVTQVAAGEYHSLALTSTGQLYAFGSNRFGQLGNWTNSKTTTPNPTPALVTLPGANGRITRIATGLDYSLALTSTGQLYTFGSDPFGELGIPPGESAAAHPTPTQVALPGTNAETVATGCWSGHTLVILDDLSISNFSLPAGELELPYSAQVEGAGGAPPYIWSASDLPKGLSINPTTGIISGTPTAAGTYTPTITLADSNSIEAPRTLALEIKGSNEPESPPRETPPSSIPNEVPLFSVPQKVLPPLAPSVTSPSPSVQKARQSARRWREGNKLAHISRDKTPTGTTFSFSLNEQATVTFSFTQLLGGLQDAHNCFAKTHTHKNVKGTICDTARAGKLSFVGHSGTNNVIFAGRTSRAGKLKPGRYKLTITATNSSGQRSTPVSLFFTIVK